jgi:hypothetical protein
MVATYCTGHAAVGKMAKRAAANVFSSRFIFFAERLVI